MTELLGTFLIIIFCLTISLYEYKKFNTIITPFGVIAWPYTIIIILINFIAIHYTFFPVKLSNILFVISSLLRNILPSSGEVFSKVII